MTSKITSLNNIHILRKWVHTICANAKLDVEFDDEVPGPLTSRNRLVLPTFNSNMTVDDEKRIRHFVLHEVSHHNEGPEYFSIIEDNNLDFTHPLGAIGNLFEDHRIERAASKRYIGDERIISDGMELTCKKIYDETVIASTRCEDGELHPDSARITAASVIARMAWGDWCAGACVYMRDELRVIEEHFPSVVEYINLLNKHDVVTSILDVQDEQQTFDLAKKVYGLLWDKSEDEVEKEIEELKQQQEEGKGKEEEGEEGEGKGKGKSKRKVEDREGGDPQEGDFDPRTGKYRIPFKKLLTSDHDSYKDATEPMGHGLGLDYTNHKRTDRFEPEDFNHMRIIDYSVVEPKSRNIINRWGNRSDLTATSSFANRMRRYLQVRSASRYVGGKKKGKINPRSLYRAGVPIVGDGEWNRKVFRQKHESDLLDTCVQVLVDMSGSMCGPKCYHATKAAMLLNHVISNTLRVNTEVLTFSFDHETMIGIIKGFNTKASDDQIYSRFDDFAGYMWGNDDADAILYGYHRLLQQRQKRKVMIVLSDGSPADGIGDTDPYYALKRTVGEIENSRKADIIGIGIMDYNVKDYYKKHTLIKRAEELEDGLIKVITSNILSGGNA